MASPNTVNVTNIASKTDDKEIRDFFSFCGKIADTKVTLEGETKSATVTFEKETAAKTALLLNNTKLGDNEIRVTSPAGTTLDDGGSPPFRQQAERDTDEITQEEKPRARILAEYLAHGYVVADAGLKTAIALDEKHGVSTRFLTTLQSLDQKYHATDRAKTADKSYGITQRAGSLWSGLGSYFERATNTPTGKRIVKFYADGTRQVSDVHSEARRLAELKKLEHGGSAYKAAGLERVFGPEKTQQAGASTAPAASTESTTAPTAAPTATGEGATAPKDEAPAKA